ncbi:MAG: GNAT family N-acetyltransferase [Clostridia bacterium]
MTDYTMKIIIRDITREDADKFSYAFLTQGWNKPSSQFLNYYREQKQGKRKVFVAEYLGDVLGYVTLVPSAKHGPFKDSKIPEIVDFNVLKAYQNNGIGALLLDSAESFASSRFDSVCLGVGLHKGYGAAQRMYIKRGYIPDGTGVWYDDENLDEMVNTVNDDNLILYMKKDLKKLIR